MRRNRLDEPENGGSSFPEMHAAGDPLKKLPVTADVRTDYTQVLQEWLGTPLSSPPFDKTSAEIRLKPEKPYFDIKLTVGSSVEAKEKSDVLRAITEWVGKTRAPDLMRESHARPVYGNASHIAASRAHFKLSQPDFDVIKGTTTVRFSFAGAESKQAFLKALATQGADMASGLFERGA